MEIDIIFKMLNSVILWAFHRKIHGCCSILHLTYWKDTPYFGYTEHYIICSAFTKSITVWLLFSNFEISEALSPYHFNPILPGQFEVTSNYYQHGILKWNKNNLIFVRNAQFYWRTKCFIHALTFPLYHNDVAFSILSFVYLDFCLFIHRRLSY